MVPNYRSEGTRSISYVTESQGASLRIDTQMLLRNDRKHETKLTLVSDDQENSDWVVAKVILQGHSDLKNKTKTKKNKGKEGTQPPLE